MQSSAPASGAASFCAFAHGPSCGAGGAGHQHPVHCNVSQPAVGGAHEGQRRPVSFRRDAPCVYNHEAGFPGRLKALPRGAHEIAHRLAVGAGRPASEMLHMKAWHFLSF